MGRSWRWYVALHALLALGALMEEVLLFRRAHRRIPGSEGALGLASKLAHGFGALALGTIFDRAGPVACLLVANASFLVFEAVGSHAFHCLGHLAHSLAHPTLIPFALALRECDAEDRAGIASQAFLNIGLVSLAFSSRSLWLMFYGGKKLFFSLPFVSFAVGVYLSRAVPDRDLGKPAAGRAAFSDASARERLWRILLRPAVLTTFSLLVALCFVRDVQQLASGFDASALSGLHFSGKSLAFASNACEVIGYASWTFLPAMCVRKLGPNAAIHALLGAVAAVLALDTTLCLLTLPPSLSAARRLIIHLSLLPVALARDFTEVVCTVFLIGVVGRGERGTLASLKAFFGIHGHFPIPLDMVAGPLYKRGGLPAIFSLNSGLCIGMLLLFRRSPLMRVKLKDS